MSPLKSLSPVSISYRTTPSEKMSVRRSTFFPHACSGDMYWSLPFSAPACVCWTFVAAFAMPKSQSLMSPSKLMRTFCGETSRWTRFSSLPSIPIRRWA